MKLSCDKRILNIKYRIFCLKDINKGKGKMEKKKKRELFSYLKRCDAMKHLAQHLTYHKNTMNTSLHSSLDEIVRLIPTAEVTEIQIQNARNC